MVLLIFLTAIVAIIALFCSIISYELGYFLLGDWSSRVGLGAVTLFFFAMIGIATKKVLKQIGLVIFKRFYSIDNYSKIDTT